MQKINEQQKNFNSQPFVTWFLLGISVCLYIAMMETAQLSSVSTLTNWIDWGAADPVHIWYGEIWRLATAIFLHGNLLHLVLNCFVLIQVGRLLEPNIGHGRFLLVFLVSGIVGFACSLLFNASISIGSSGAVFGVIGALIGLFLILPNQNTDRKLLKSLLAFVGINFAFGFLFNLGFSSSIAIDNMAHLGGFTSGLLLGVAFAVDTPLCKIFDKKHKNFKLIIINSSLALCFVLLFVSVSLAVRPFNSVNYYYQMGLYNLGQGNLEESDNMLAALSLLSQDDIRVELLQGRLAVKKNDRHSAIEYFVSAINKQSDLKSFWDMNFKNSYQGMDYADLLFVDEKSNSILCDQIIGQKKEYIDAEMFNDCAWLKLMAKESTEADKRVALEWAKQAVQVSESIDPKILHTMAEAYAQNGKISEAILAVERALLQHPKNEKFFKGEKQRFKKLVQNSINERTL